jgi:hypothetical protein
MTALSIGSSAGGSVLSAFGALGEGKSQSAMYGYQAQVARLNAQIDRQNAEWELAKGDTEALQYGMKAGQQFAAIRTGQAASNLDVNSGSAKEVQDSQRKIIQMDNATIRENATKAAYNWTAKAAMDENQATLYDYAGAQAKKAGALKALGSIIGGVSSVSSKWTTGVQSGLIGGGGTGGIKLFDENQRVVGYA